MEQLGSCTSISYRENYSVGTRHSVRDRFQGALLGLGLAPTAIRLGRSPLANDLAGKLAEASAFSLEQVSAFLQRSPAVYRLPIPIDSRTCGYETLLLASLPGLLRYHDSWEQRSHWIRQISLRLSSYPNISERSLAATSEPTQAAALALVFVLGDLLELLLSGYRFSLIAGLRQLQERAVGNILSALEQQHYRQLLAALSVGVSNGVLTTRQEMSTAPAASLQNLLQPAEITEQQRFVDAALLALLHPESYRIPVQMAASRGGIAPLVTAVIAGAGGGRAFLPVLWQTCPRCPQILSLADDLFNRWAGIAR